MFHYYKLPIIKGNLPSPKHLNRRIYGNPWDLICVPVSKIILRQIVDVDLRLVNGSTSTICPKILFETKPCRIVCNRF